MADLRPQFSEEVVAHGHPTKADTTNRAWDVEHEEDGTHKDNVIVNDNLGPDCVDGTKIEDDAIDSEHYTDGSIDLAHMSANSVSTDQYVDGSIDSVHISTDLAGTGLTGGDGASLSVDGIVEQGAGAAELKVKVIDIGDWNMDLNANLVKAHGLTQTNIRSISVLIRIDAAGGDSIYDLTGYTAAVDGYFFTSAANITLHRLAAGGFDNANFDQVGFNRGWITIWYVA